MGLLSKLKEYLELKQEEKLYLKEIAQERVNKKRELEKRKAEFEELLQKRIPCEYLIKLTNPFTANVNFYMIDTIPFTYRLFLSENVSLIPIKIMQLTGIGAGQIYSGTINPNLDFEDKVMVRISPKKQDKLHISVNGYTNEFVDADFIKENYFEKKFGKTVRIAELLMLYKSENGQMMDVTFNQDYEMVKRIYECEKIISDIRQEKKKIFKGDYEDFSSKS